MVTVCILQGYGINADQELIDAFELAGANAVGVHVADLIAEPGVLGRYRALAFPGGFSFGDHLGSGRVLAALLNARIRRELNAFVADGGLVLGICNGFQVLVKMGLLPGDSPDQSVSLVHNTNGRFIDAWVGLMRNPRNRSPWRCAIERADMPIRHGEGRFVCGTDVRRTLLDSNRVAFTYQDPNPNGSLDSIAGITDGTGRILGMMPHPEAYRSPLNHPAWHRDSATEPTGIAVFRNAVDFAERSQ